MQPGILVLTASAGAGHVVAARAMEEALRSSAPDARIEVIDVLQLSNRLFRTFYAGGYLRLVRHAPIAMGILYDRMDRPNGRLSNAVRVAAQNPHVRPIRRAILERRPDLILNTHFLPAEIVAQMRRRGVLRCPQATVTTDFDTHRMWVNPPTERYYTATEDGKAYLATWDVDPQQIAVTGIPVRRAFEQAGDRAALRTRLGLNDAAPVVLLLCGGFGVGPTESLLRELLAMGAAAQIVVIAGRNEALRARLARVAAAATGLAAARAGRAAGAPSAERARPTAIVVGFTERMYDWMQAADLVVTKPGGLTVSEALVCGRPLVVVNPIPGQEARNSDYLLENGAAIKVNNPRLLGYRVARLLEDAAWLGRLSAAARQIARPGAAQRIARDALSLLRETAAATAI